MKISIYIFLLFVGFLLQGNTFSQTTVNNNDTNVLKVKSFDDIIKSYKSGEKGINYTISCASVKETCYGDCDGTITVDVATGAPTYPVTIFLDADASCSTGDQMISGIMALPYTFINICGCGVDYSVVVIDNISDMDGCSATVTGKSPITPIKTITNETCPGACDGQIVINFIFPVSGAPYTHSWSNGATTSTISSLCAGSYSDTIRDKDGCSDIFTYIVTAPPPLAPTATNTGPYCLGDLIQLNVDAYTFYS